MFWARLLAYVTGTVNQELLLRNEYLAAENRILRNQIRSRVLLSDGEKATVPTVTFSLLYCFFIISHHRRRILHFNVTKHPTSSWIAQQLREAFPFDSAPRFLIFDSRCQVRTGSPGRCSLLKHPSGSDFL